MTKLALLLLAAATAFFTGLTLFHLGMLVFVRSGGEAQVPDLVGLDVASARRAIAEREFTAVVDREEHSGEFSAGKVLGQRPDPGEVLRQGRKVRLTVSLGPRKAAVPNVVGLSYRQAGILLSRDGLAVGGVCRLRHDTVARGDVIAQDPPVGASRSEGTRVDLLVSLGPEPKAFVLPDLAGRPASEVESLLRRYGLEVGDKTVLIDRSVLPSTVLEHDPRPGTRVETGDRLHLVVSSRR